MMKQIPTHCKEDVSALIKTVAYKPKDIDFIPISTFKEIT